MGYSQIKYQSWLLRLELLWLFLICLEQYFNIKYPPTSLSLINYAILKFLKYCKW